MRISALNRSNTNLSLFNARNIKIKVTDIINNNVTIYHAIKAAARALYIDRRLIEYFLYIDNNKPVLGKYTFELLTNNNLSSNIQKNSKEIEVININTNEIKSYPSIGSAARDLKLHQASISLYMRENRVKPFKGIYIFKYK
jgi:hypothetical protein